MRAEARPLIELFSLQHVADFFSPLPCQLHRGRVNGAEIYVVNNGVQHDRDLIGCEAAAITTMAAIERLRPDIVISSGTCGGWHRKGAKTGQVYIGNGVMFHDRRVPGDNAWATQGLGNYPLWQGSAGLAERLGLPMGKVTTGSSFDMTKEEEDIIDQNGGQLKEMEAAAVAFVGDIFHTPVMCVKSVTNLRDVDDDNMDAFQDNLRKASRALTEANRRIVQELTKQDVTSTNE